MRQFFAFLFSLIICAQGAIAQSGYSPPSGSGGAYQGSTVAPGTSGNVMTSNGTAWTSAAAAGGGGSSPLPAGFVTLSAFDDTGGYLAMSPDGVYAYVSGILVSNSHGAIAQVKIADGTVNATVDLGAGVRPTGLVVSSDSAAIYAFDQTAGVKWWKVAASGMSLTHTSTLAVAAVTGFGASQKFDISPDGAIYAYISGADAKLYMINTTTYVVTNQTMNHTAGNLTAVCFYQGSSSDVYVAHASQDGIDKYSTAGVYDSTVSTGAGGTPNFTVMRSGINGLMFVADSGTQPAVIAVDSGTPTIYRINGGVGALSVNSLTDTAICEGDDICVFTASGGSGSNFGTLFAIADYGLALRGLPTPTATDSDHDGFTSTAWLPTGCSVYALSGCTAPTLWSIPGNFPDPPTGAAGNVQVSNGLGSWVTTSKVTANPTTGDLHADGNLTVTGGLTSNGSANVSSLLSNTDVTAYGQAVITGDIDTGGNFYSSGGDLVLAAPGYGIQIKTGSNTKIGSATLSGGAVTVSNTAVTANSLIFLTGTGGTITNLGFVYEDKASRVNGTSFRVKSSNVLDASDFDYVIIEARP